VYVLYVNKGSSAEYNHFIILHTLSTESDQNTVLSNYFRSGCIFRLCATNRSLNFGEMAHAESGQYW